VKKLDKDSPEKFSGDFFILGIDKAKYI